MLVLSRRPGEKILFPGLGVSLEVLRSRGNVVRLGIEAPTEIAVIRAEISDQEFACRTDTDSPSQLQRHEFRNRLNILTLKLELLKRRIEIGQIEDSDQDLADAISELASLEQRIVDTKVVPKEAVGLRVLVIEDHPSERELLASCLRMAGMNVTTLGDGQAALDYLSHNEPPDLVLLDMRMPGMDGPTLLNAVRKDERLNGMRIFAVSGSPQSQFSSNLLPLDGWFSKPVRVDALIQAMRVDHTSITATA